MSSAVRSRSQLPVLYSSAFHQPAPSTLRIRSRSPTRRSGRPSSGGRRRSTRLRARSITPPSQSRGRSANSRTAPPAMATRHTTTAIEPTRKRLRSTEAPVTRMATMLITGRPSSVAILVTGASVERNLFRVGSIAVVVCLVAMAGGAVLLFADRPLLWLGGVIERARNRVLRRRPPLEGLPERLVNERDLIRRVLGAGWWKALLYLSLIHISEPTRRTPISYAVFC